MKFTQNISAESWGEEKRKRFQIIIKNCGKKTRKRQKKTIKSVYREKVTFGLNELKNSLNFCTFFKKILKFEKILLFELSLVKTGKKTVERLRKTSKRKIK